jgi:acyl-CoA thioester hydrolase
LVETYRGVVYRWELDHNDHLTVAYYFQRIGDASQALLEALGLGPGYTARTGFRYTTADCYVRYIRELNVPDLVHMTSAVIDVRDDGFVAGHRLIDSVTGEVVTFVQQRLTRVDPNGRRAALPAHEWHDFEVRRDGWDGPPREQRPRPEGDDGFRDTARDVIRASELDGSGQIGFAAYIHRFSAANGHAVAAFGLTPEYSRAERRGFSTFEFQIEFSGALAPGDPVVVKSALVHLGSSSMRLLHRMANVRTGMRVAMLEQFGVHLDMDTRRATPIPDAMRDKARALLAGG